jgi:sterol desaturase/sphingolipid hydroxylase (fatty acid hydroxylase superfamily)
VPPGVFAVWRDSPWLQFVAGLLVLDLMAYVFHRLTHAVPWLWAIHCVHHSDPALDASTGLRFHPLEGGLAVVAAVGLLWAAGLPAWVAGARAIIMNPLAMAQHASVLFPGPVERAAAWLLVTPGMHRVHHSIDPRYYNRNFGQMFSFWDRLFGTYLAPAAMPATPIGVAGLEAERWQSVGGLLLTPWRQWRRGAGTPPVA